jgi:hypothetical protein
MRRTLLWLTLALLTASLAAAQQSSITRLDGSTISAAEIDAT